jgi:hypothetical protein
VKLLRLVMEFDESYEARERTAPLARRWAIFMRTFREYSLESRIGKVTCMGWSSRGPRLVWIPSSLRGNFSEVSDSYRKERDRDDLRAESFRPRAGSHLRD